MDCVVCAELDREGQCGVAYVRSLRMVHAMLGDEPKDPLGLLFWEAGDCGRCLRRLATSLGLQLVASRVAEDGRLPTLEALEAEMLRFLDEVQA